MTRSESLGGVQQISANIRRAILDGTFAPGQRLVEAELTELYDTKRGPVRAALVDLEHQGLVERQANRGARVRAITLDEAVAVTEVRLAVEGLCAAKAASRITDDEVAELRHLGADLERSVQQGDVVGYSRLNQQLDVRITQIADQGVASEVLETLRARNVRHQFRLALRPGRPHVSLREHLEIIDAVCDRDPERAERAVRTHLVSVIEALREAATDASTPASLQIS